MLRIYSRGASLQLRKLFHHATSDTLANGIRVSTVPSSRSTVTTVNISVKAGTRYEVNSEDKGVSQALRCFALSSASNSTLLKNIVVIESTGGSLDVSVSRELISYNLTAEAHNMKSALECLVGAISEPQYPHWEISKPELKNAAHLDRFLFCDDHRNIVLNNAHGCMFRTGLGNSLVPCDDTIRRMSGKEMLPYHKSQFAPSNVVVAAANLPDKFLSETLSRWEFPSSDMPHATAAHVPSKYHSGDVRDYRETSKHVTAALAAPGGPLNSKEAIACGILASLFSDVAVLPFGKSASPVQNRLGKDESIAAFNCDYSDAGLFGFLFQLQPEGARNKIKAFLDSAKKVRDSLTEDHVAIGRNNFVRELLRDLESGNQQRAEHVAINLMWEAEGAVTGHSHEQFRDNVHSITTADLQKALDRVLGGAKGPRVMSSCGNLIDTPYIDQL